MIPETIIFSALALLFAYFAFRNSRISTSTTADTLDRLISMKRVFGWSAATLFIVTFTLSTTVSGWPALAALMLTFFALLLSSYIAHVAKAPNVTSAASLLGAFKISTAHDWLEVTSRSRMIRKTIAPDGWHQFRLRIDVIFDRLASLRVFLVAYGVALAAMPALFAIIAVSQFGSEDDAVGMVFRTYASYYLLLCASCLTFALVATLATIAALRAVGIIMWKPDYRQVITVVTSWAGTGVVFGAAVAALTPLFVGVWPILGSSEIFHGNAVTPQLLLNLSAAGAGLGYAFGLIASLYSVSQNAVNLVHRFIVAPVIFTGWSWATGVTHFANPSSIANRIVDSIRPSTRPITQNMTVNEAEALLNEDWRRALIFIAEYNFPFPGALSWPLTVSITLGIVTGIVFVVSVTRRLKVTSESAANIPGYEN